MSGLHRSVSESSRNALPPKELLDDLCRSVFTFFHGILFIHVKSSVSGSSTVRSEIGTLQSWRIPTAGYVELNFINGIRDYRITNQISAAVHWIAGIVLWFG
eukprot:Gb_25052 [translate_table: standard]